MIITNNTEQNITLLNGEILKRLETKKISNVTEQLMEQLKKLKELGIIGF